VYNNDTIACRVHVELDSIRAELDRAKKCGYRIFRQCLVRPAVGDAFGFWVSA
jgi:hypothetical protein